MPNRHIITGALLTALALTFGACGSSSHQTAPHPSTTGATATTTDQTRTTTVPTTARPPGTTTTTVLGPSGPPSSYPAAQPNPPSLAGAYPHGTTVNLITVLKTLTTYEDWVWSHPNPALVANYDRINGEDYAGELKDISEIQQDGLHADPTPSQILFARVSTPATPELVGGKPFLINGYQSFRGGLVTIVSNVVPVPMLKANGQLSGQQFNPTTLGQVAFTVTLAQGSDGQFRFEQTKQFSPLGGIAALEHRP